MALDMDNIAPPKNYSAITETTVDIDDDTNTKGQQPGSGLYRENEAYGYVLVFFSAVLFCMMFLLMRSATYYNGVAVSCVVFLRGLTQIVLATASSWAFLDMRRIFFVPKDLLPLLAARGIFGALSLTLSYISISLVPLSLESTLFFTNPIFTMILSATLLSERVGFREVIAAVLSIIGVGFVSNPTLSLFTGDVDVGSSGYVMGIVTALGSAMLVAVAHIAIRSLGMRVHFMTNVLAFAVCETVIGACMGGIGSVLSLTNNERGFWITLAACFCGFIAQCLFCKGLQHCRAGTGSIIRTVDVPLAYVLGLVFLGETSNFVAVAGSGLVLAGMIIIGWDAAMNGEKEDELPNDDAHSNSQLCEAK